MSAEPKTAGQHVAAEGVSSLGKPPSFFSLSFHLRFFPSVLARRCRIRGRQAKGSRSPFASHVPLELPLAFMACIVLVAIGIPQLLCAHRMFGGMLAGAGLAGILAMFVSSVRSENSRRAGTGRTYTYDDFAAPVFFFFLLLGLTAGLSLSYLSGEARRVVLYGIIGLIAGYVSGIFLSVMVNYLGWIGTFAGYLCVAASIGMAIFDVIVLFLLLQ